jgi:hypothetical protein
MELNRMQIGKGQYRYVQRQQRVVPGHGEVCWVCGSSQHWARDCPKKYRKKQSAGD